MKRIFLAFLALIISTPAFAQAWTDGPQPIVYSTNRLGDGTNSRGGEAPYFAIEPDDIPTNPTIKSNWTMTSTTLLDQSEFNLPSFNAANCTGIHSTACGNGTESKARFDCNAASEENSDPIVHPYQAGNNSHRHTFYGNVAAAGNMDKVDYAWLRTHPYSTCYGGPMNATLYWETDLFVKRGGIDVALKPYNQVTYYVCGNLTTDPPTCTRWPRDFAAIFGFDPNDPNNTRLTSHYAGNPSYSGTFNGFVGWHCQTDATPSYTAYAPNQKQGASQPYLNDGNGHPTLNCQTQTAGGVSNAIIVYAELNSQSCWDGHNPQSPDGRSHVAFRIQKNDGKGYCPDNWYRIPFFLVKTAYVFKYVNEMATAHLASDQMPGMPVFKGGQTMHADGFWAWDYGTGDNPGFMLLFFRDCLGMNMHVKNSDGVTYTDLSPPLGSGATCGYGRISQNINGQVNGIPPDGIGPNPVVNLNPDQTGIARFFPIPTGTSMPNAVLHQKH